MSLADDSQKWQRLALDANGRLAVADGHLNRLIEAIEHVIADSPGTPQSVKNYLQASLSFVPRRPEDYAALMTRFVGEAAARPTEGET